jgi:four helix bundle protein
MVAELSFDEWVNSIPPRMKTDPLWESAYYRLAMYLYDLIWNDCESLRKDFRGREVTNQLIRCAGGICVNMEEAYGRGIGSADHIRVLRIALGKARETQGWLFRSRHLLPAEKLTRRLDLINQIISLLVSSINSQKRRLANT